MGSGTPLPMRLYPSTSRFMYLSLSYRVIMPLVLEKYVQD